ncbi:MAG: hypothetical protein ACR2OZ_09690 [Verrucomicrobiales bacterium]
MMKRLRSLLGRENVDLPHLRTSRGDGVRARWIVAWVCLAVAAVIVVGPMQAGGTGWDAGAVAVGMWLGVVALITLAAVLLAPELTLFVAGPLLRWVDSVYLGDAGAPEQSPADFGLPRRLLAERSYEAALESYESLIRSFPDSPLLYREAIVAARLAEQNEEAGGLFRMGLHHCPQAARLLQEALFAEPPPLPPLPFHALTPLPPGASLRG